MEGPCNARAWEGKLGRDPMARFSTAFRNTTQAGIALLGIGIGGALGWLAIRGADWNGVRDAIADLSPWVLLAAFGLALVSAWLRAMRWRYTWVGYNVSIMRLFLVENASLGINNVSPIRMWDEVASLAMLVVHDKLPAGAVVATIVMTRAQDLVFTLSFVVISLLAAPELTEFARPVVFVSIFFFAMLIIVLNLGRIVQRFPALQRIPGVTSFGGAVNSLWTRKRRLALTFGLTAAYWLTLGPVGWVIGREMGIELSLFHFTLVALGSVFFATATPGLPGAVGTFEFATVRLLSVWDVPQGTALGFSVVLHMVLFLPPVIIAMFVLPREGMVSMATWRDRARRVEEQRATEVPTP